MPIHPAVASKFYLLDGIDSFEVGLADPVTRARMDEFMSHNGAPPPPAVDEPGADLAVALAIASAAKGVAVKDGLAAFGELGLTGRLRAATQAERRLEECAKLGFRAVARPEGHGSPRRARTGRGRERGQALALGLGRARTRRL